MRLDDDDVDAGSDALQRHPQRASQQQKIVSCSNGKRALPHVLRDAQASSNSFNSPKPGRIRLDCSSASTSSYAHGSHTCVHTHTHTLIRTQVMPLLLLPVASLPASAASFFLYLFYDSFLVFFFAFACYNFYSTLPSDFAVAAASHPLRVL